MDNNADKWKRALQPEDCPRIEALMDALAEDELSAEFEKHLATCPRCEAEVEMYREFERGAVDPSQEDDVAWIVRRLEDASPVAGPDIGSSRSELSGGPLRKLVGWFTGGSWRSLAPIGAALVAATLLLVVWRPGPGDVGEISDPSITRSSGVELTVAPLANLLEPPLSLTWKAPKDASSFVVRIYEVDRTELWKGESDVESIQIPEAVRAQMSAGRRFLWQVVALDAAGGRVSVSEMGDFEIRVPSSPPRKGDR